MFGTAAGEKLPQMLVSEKSGVDQQVSLLTLLFETNPLDGKADQRIRLNTNPLKIVYDAVSNIMQGYRIKQILFKLKLIFPFKSKLME